ncbi:hypothetical protein BH24PSE2_BH24PSE2_13920 [soil metagenome]
MLETAPRARSSPLLNGPPLLFRPSGGEQAALVAVLSEQGCDALYQHGRPALEARLEELVEGSEARRRWCLVGPAWSAESAELERRLAIALHAAHVPQRPTVLRESAHDGRHDYLLHVCERTAWFNGHFPGAPVLPGVVQIDWAVHHGAALGFSPRGFCGLARLKFKSLIRPDAVLRLSLEPAGRDRLDFVYASRQTRHSEGSIRYAA